MRRFITGIALVLVAATAAAELQHVTIGGEIRIRARYRDQFTDGPSPRFVAPASLFPGRALGSGAGILSRFDFGNDNRSQDFLEQRTTLNVTADFTDRIRAFMEMEYYRRWGRDFRSNYITGADFQRSSAGDVQLIQSYIEANDFLIDDLRLRIGRQQLTLGRGFLISNKSSSLRSTEFDMIRFTYAPERPYEFDAYWGLLAENSAIEQDEDVTIAGLYGTYHFTDWISGSAYWNLIRDARSINDTNFIAPVEWLEDALGVDNYDPSYLHTIGMRLWGEYGKFDYDFDLGYQFGDADVIGSGFKPFGVYGDDGAEYDNIGLDAELGYNFEMKHLKRAYLGFALYEGEDNRSISFAEWLNPFDRPEASVSWNRHFPAWKYSNFFDNVFSFSNFMQVRAGVEYEITDAVSGELGLEYYWADETFDFPWSVDIGGYRVPIAPGLSFLTDEGSDDLGLVTAVGFRYDYSADLSVRLRWEHLFAGDGIDDIVYSDSNGLLATAGPGKDDKDYVELRFVLGF